MEPTRYVRHISGQGALWKLWKLYAYPIPHLTYWCVQDASGELFYLPKNEYVLYDPPEEWEDVTSRLRLVRNEVGEAVLCEGDCIATVHYAGHYRLRLAPFKVERRKDQP